MPLGKENTEVEELKLPGLLVWATKVVVGPGGPPPSGVRIQGVFITVVLQQKIYPFLNMRRSDHLFDGRDLAFGVAEFAPPIYQCCQE